MRLRWAGTVAGADSGGSSLISACDRAGLVSWLHRVTSRSPAARVPLRSSPIGAVISSNCRVSSASDCAAKRRRLLSTSEAVTDAVTTARKPIPASITTAAMNRPAGLLRRDVPIPHGGDRLQREPETLADRRILLMVEEPLEDPARNRDHHRERGDDPRRPARGQRITQHQTRRQRHLPRSIRRFVLDYLSLAMLGLVRLRGSWLSHFRLTYLRDGARSTSHRPSGADAVRRRAVGCGLVQGLLVLVAGRGLEVEDDFLHRAGEGVRSLAA